MMAVRFWYASMRSRAIEESNDDNPHDFSRRTRSLMHFPRHHADYISAVRRLARRSARVTPVMRFRVGQSRDSMSNRCDSDVESKRLKTYKKCLKQCRVAEICVLSKMNATLSNRIAK